MSKTTLQLRVVLIVALLTFGACSVATSLAPKLNDQQSTLDNIRHSPAPLGWYAIHRGNIAVWPGNTEFGIRAAVARSAKLIEVDVRRSKDGSLFLFHDRRLNENNFAGPSKWLGRVAESLSDQELDHLCFPPDNRECVINFTKALELIVRTSTAYLLDVKNADLAMISQIVSQASSSNQLEQIIIQVPSVEKLSLVRKFHPELAILARCFNPDEVKKALAFNPEIIQIDEPWMTKTIIDNIHKNSSKVLVKTIDRDDSAEHHRRLFEARVDIVLTDNILSR